MPPTADATNAELLTWTLGRLNDRDLAALRDIWADDVVERFPDRTCRGADELTRYFQDAFAAMPDWHMEQLAIAESGDDVLVRWRLTGTHDGPLMGIEPTGKPVVIDGIDHAVVRDGRLVSNFVVFDQMQYARQIGMLPPDGSATDRALKALFNARTRLAAKLRR
jgi:predicted ester cyclase